MARTSIVPYDQGTKTSYKELRAMQYIALALRILFVGAKKLFQENRVTSITIIATCVGIGLIYIGRVSVSAQTYTVTLEQPTDPQGAAVSVSLSIDNKEEEPKVWSHDAPTNEAAPVDEKFIAENAKPLDYINRFKSVAIAEMRKYGVPASISIAQGLIESRAGTSKLAVNANNHFGIKCFSRKCRKGHCLNFTDDTHKDFFRKFPTAWESWRAHSEMISTGRYAKLKKYGHDYQRWAKGLKAVGYATDPSYAEKLIGVIKKYQLHKLDH